MPLPQLLNPKPFREMPLHVRAVADHEVGVALDSEGTIETRIITNIVPLGHRRYIT